MLYVINQINKKDENVSNFVYDTRQEAFENFKILFHGREKDKDGDTPEICFFDYGGARFDDYDLNLNVVNLNEKMY